MEITAKVAELDELRQLAVPRRLELAAVLAQLRRDPLVAEEPVHILLRGEGVQLATLHFGDPVLGDRQSTPDGGFAQRDVVIFRAREVLQQVAVRLRWNDSEVEAQSVLRDHRRLRPTARRHLDHPRRRAKRVDQRLRVGCSGDQVEIAHRLAIAAGGAGDRHLQRGGIGGELGRERA